MAGLYGCCKGRNSDRAAMASGSPDVTTNQEPAEVQEECSGKKKSKFQTFKRFFARKKRKEPSAAGSDAALKASQSTDNVSKASENNTLTRSEKDKGSGSKISLGSKALSHDSVFVSDSSEANEALGASQDSIHGKVKSLQLQLKQAIRLGSPPSLMCVKKAEDGGTMSEDDGLPCSPPEYTTHQTVMNQAQMNSSISLEGIDSDDEQLSHAASSRAMSPLVVPGDFSLPASPFGCLDNSAAKHKLGLRHKACNRRKPTSRPEGKTEGDSAVEEMLTTSMQEVETDGMEEEQQQRTEDVIDHQLKPKVEKEEEEDEVEETEPPQHSRRSLLKDKEEEEKEEEVVGEEEEEEEEGEDEPETEQDVSHGPDTSCPPEPRLSEEEASESQPLPSSEPSSRASSLDSPRATPEPPTGLREYLLDPPGFLYGADKKFDSDSASESEEDGIQETMEEEEETSFLQEVLSSLKTPLGSCSLDVKTEDVFLEMKQEADGKSKEEAEIEEGEEVKEEEAEEHQPIGYQFTPFCSALSGQATEEEEVVTPSYQEQEEEEGEEKEVVAVEEEVKGEEEEEQAAEEELEDQEEEEDVAVEQITQHGREEEEGQKEDAEEVQPEEESSVLTRQIISQAEEEEESEGEEEAIELEKEPEVEEEGREKTEDDDDDDGVVAVEVNEGKGVEEAEEMMVEEKSDAEEMLPDAQEEAEAQSETSMQEVDEGVVLTDAAHDDHDDEIPADLGDEVVAPGQEEQEKSNQTSGDEMENGEEGADDGEEITVEEKKQEEVEANQTDVDETEQDPKQESVEATPHSDVAPGEATEQASVSSRPPSLTLPESPSETRSQASGPTTPSKTSVIHINLISPSSEKATSFFQTSPTKAEPSENATQRSPPLDSTEEKEMDLAGGEKEEEKEPAQVQDAAAPASAEEAADQLPCSADQSKARFTISPAWQRSQSLTPPSSPPASSSSTVAAPSSEEVEEAANKVELVLSPSRMRSAGSTVAKPQSTATPPPVKPQTSAPASTEESSPVVEGSNPFGVRLRKTSGLLRVSSEEENTEPPVESPTPPTSNKVDPPQPVSVKPSVHQPIGNKPVVPKKPEVHGDAGGKLKRISDTATGRGTSPGTDSPSWISMAKQKQKIYKESSLEEITVKKEEQERKSSLPIYVSSAASREHSNKTAESSSKASQSEISKPSASAEKETKRALSPPTPVPPQPSKSQSLPCPVAPKPQVPPVGAKHPPQPNAPQRSVPPPTPVPVPQKPASCTSPLSPSKPATPPKTAQVTAAPPFSSRPVPEKPGAKAAGLSGQTPSSPRGLPSPSLPQDEPPWMALAKKKAKAWSEMPQIVQ